MHKRAEYSGILVSLESLTHGKLQQLIESNKDGDSREIKRVKRLIRLSKDEENDFRVTQGTEETTSTNEQLAGLWALAFSKEKHD